MIPICEQCGRVCNEKCEAFHLLESIYTEQRIQDKENLLKELRKQLGFTDSEVSNELRELALKIIQKMPDLTLIPENEIRIGYVLSYKEKKKDGKTIFADCRKVTAPFDAFLPFDFLITFYEPNVILLTNNQKKIVMYHELSHIGINEKGYTLEDHDVEDFLKILDKYGSRWNSSGADVPDILDGGEDETKTKNKKEKRKQK